MKEEKKMTRREALKKMGVMAAATATAASGIEALAACSPDNKFSFRKMKVLLLNGSPRPSGNTATLLREAAAQLEKNGIESEIVNIGGTAIHGCTACAACRSNAEHHCIFKDDICNRLIDLMAKSDAVIVGSPVYYGQPNGAVLAILQRMAYAGGAYMQGKPAAAVTVCRRGGASAAFQTLQMPFQMLNMPIVTSQYWNIAYGSAPGQVSQDEEGMQTMRTLADNMAYMLKQFESGKARKPEREPGTFTNFIR